MKQTTPLPEPTTGIPRLLLIWLALLAGMTYLTGFGLVPGVANNIGPFEFVAGILIMVTVAYLFQNNLRVYNHPLMRILALIILIAGIDLVKMSENAVWGITHWLLLVYALALLLVFYNLIIRYPEVVRYLLRFLAYAVTLAALWVVIDGFLSGGDVNAAGPFRSRAHVGIYLVSSFWIVLIYLSHPGTSRRERVLLYSFIPFVLYGIAVAGRRSVYLAFAVGSIILIVGLIFMLRQERGRILPALLVGVGFLAFLYFGEGSPLLPNTHFFRTRVGTVEDRVRAFTGDEEVLSDDENFILLQRRGMWAAVQDYPLLGIGWGGFYNSRYSPTGHEMHSTPQRFLAELGLLGFSLYLIFTGYILIGSLKVARKAMGTPYQISTFILAVALWSLHVSWFYNRSITDRTYWLLLILLMGYEVILSGKQEAQSQQRLPMTVSNIRRQFHQS